MEFVGEQTESRLYVFNGYSRRDTSEQKLENEDPDELYGSAATDTESVLTYMRPSETTIPCLTLPQQVARDHQRNALELFCQVRRRSHKGGKVR